MYVGRSGAQLVVQTPAKLNLLFEVLAKRGDGYHEIQTLMCPISLFDTLYFQENSSAQLELTCQPGARGAAGQGDEPLAVPQGSENLVIRAAELLRQRAGVTRGARLRLVKRIPTAAGLGGGSSDAAATLAAANLGWGIGWSRAELAALGAELGSDVPFFLQGGTAICGGRGERVERVEAGGPLHFVVVRPPVGLSTAAVYGVCRPAESPIAPAPIVDALGRGDLGQLGRLLFNRLQPAAESLSPWIGRLRQEYSGLDCLGHSMSGSGTAYFGLCRHARHARRLARRLEAKGVGSVFAVRSCR
jgi:4-diphosphocytidyl-2-C-methyl-D-erythritol kinase